MNLMYQSPKLVEQRSLNEIRSRYGHNTDTNFNLMINMVMLILLIMAVFFLYDRYNRKTRESEFLSRNKHLQKAPFVI